MPKFRRVVLALWDFLGQNSSRPISSLPSSPLSSTFLEASLKLYLSSTLTSLSLSLSLTSLSSLSLTLSLFPSTAILPLTSDLWRRFQLAPSTASPAASSQRICLRFALQLHWYHQFKFLGKDLIFLTLISYHLGFREISLHWVIWVCAEIELDHASGSKACHLDLIVGFHLCPAWSFGP
jgi:hypothetical protein